jgi:DNA-binding phage protein
MDQAPNLNDAFRTANREKVCAALFAMILDTGNVQAFALKAGLDRTMLYRTPQRNLQFDVVLKILRAAELQLIVIGNRALSSAFQTKNTTNIGRALKVALRSNKNIRRGHPLYNIIRPPHIPRLEAVMRSLNHLGFRMAVRAKRD